ncbi:cathepsin L1-like isoform X2 [Myotis lucifugus]|uniref:cathepsin L1-like isoform X2 n=1 Tax=Myotis lucifugus TaxID=59463 RepID=UPI000CCC6ED3|nr:cathepsin L1-like isoform X2 [Myotis lucifugus]
MNPGGASSAPKFDASLDAEWQQWKATHGKVYGPNEEGWRRTVWEKNMKMIDLHNQEYNLGRQNFTLAMNAFGDMTKEEFTQVMNGYQNQKCKKRRVFREPYIAEIPTTVDWRKEGYVTPVKNQGHCGSCWAFSATGALEGQMFRKTGKLISLSEQNLVDCSQAQGNEGCNGGLMDNAFQYVKSNGGLDSEESYPYQATVGPCRYRPEDSVANVTGFVDVPGQESALMRAVATVGPISVAIDASHLSFQFYEDDFKYRKLSNQDLNVENRLLCTNDNGLPQTVSRGFCVLTQIFVALQLSAFYLR